MRETIEVHPETRHGDFSNQECHASFHVQGRHVVSDSILLKVAAGDEGAVQECIDCFGGLVWSLARRMTATAADAEDAAQEIFVDLWRSASNFDPHRASESTFVTMIARRRLIDQFRRRARQPQSTKLETSHEPPVEPSASLENRDEYLKVVRNMSKLREDEQQVIRLAVLEGLTQGEIAEQLKMPLGTVKTHARRGMRKLRELTLSQDESVREVDHA